MSIREAIRRQMAERAKHRGDDGFRPPPMTYWSLAKAARPPLPPSSVYRYLADGRDLTSAKCDRLLAALGLVLTPKYTGKTFTSIRECVRSHAAFRRMDYRKLAEKAGLPAPTVHRYLAGQRDMTSGRCDRLLTVLGVLIVHHKAHARFATHRRTWKQKQRRRGQNEG